MTVSIDKYIDFEPLIITTDTLLKDAVTLIAQKRDSPNCLLVVTANKLVGILTQSDLLRVVLKDMLCPCGTVSRPEGSPLGYIATETDLAITTVEVVMTQPVCTMLRSQCSSISLVWSYLKQHSINYLPILNDKEELIGVISSQDIAQSFLIEQFELEKNSEDSQAKSIIANSIGSNFQRAAEFDLERFFEINNMQCIVGFDGYFKRTNPALTEILGFSQDELLAEPLINFVHPEDRAITIAEEKSLIAGKTTVSFENRYRTRNGDYRWLLWTAKPYLDEKLIYAAARDISKQQATLRERKQAQSELAESENLLRTIVDSEPECVKMLRRDGTLLQMNPAGLAMIEADSLSEVIDKSVYSLIHPSHRQAYINLTESVFEGKSGRLEFKLTGLKGTSRWLETNAVPLKKNDKITALLAVTRDITQRKQAELQLQLERDFSKAVINTVGALVAVLDRQGAIISFNRTCEQITGYCFTDVKGKQVWDFLIPTEETTVNKAIFKQLLAGQFHNQYENYWLAKDGSKHLISWSNTALFDAQGEIEFIIATGIDITEQRRVWNKLEFQYQQTKIVTEITDKMRMSIELDEILQTTVTEVQQLLACDRVLIMEMQSNNTAMPISEAVLPDLTPMLGYELADPLLMGEYLARYHQGKVLAIDNIATASIDSDIKQLLTQFQIQAKLVVPILAQGELKGLLIAHQCHHPRQWQEAEIQLLNQLADRLGVALSQAQLLNYAEKLVSERTKELTTTNQLLKSEIAERELTERDLREHQQKLAGILDNADEAIITIDEGHTIQLFNQGAEQIFGYRATEIIGQQLDILLPEVYRQIHRHHINTFGQSRKQSRKMAERNRNVFGRRKDGHEFSAEASVAKLPTKSGMLYTVILKDISERQQTLEKLQASKALLAKAEKIAKIGSWEYDHETNQRSWSEELFNILGFDQDAPIPSCQEILARVHPEDLLLVKKTLRLGHSQGQAWELNYRLLLPDGKLKYIESRGEATIDSEGKILKVLETIMDVSDRIQAEKSLQRSEEQLELITDALPVLIAYIDKEQCYRYNNRTYETWFGKSRSSLEGLPLKELVGEDNYQKMIPYIEMALAGKEVTFETQSTADNVHSYWMSATYIPDLDVNGEVKGFFSMVEDITERKAIEKMKSEFISIASHEMRTPLTSIHGVLKLLSVERLGKLDARGKTMAAMALRNSDRLVQLVSDILDLERIESGRDEIIKTTCNSAKLIQQAIDTISSMAKVQGIILETNSESIEFLGDRDRLTQALTNFLSNAIKFSTEHSKVTITARLHDNNILFSVTDKGRGIPADKLETIFERFQQVDASDSRQKGGTGLGLAICRHIVEQHGGKIWVESVYGQGSTFYFSIPLS